jgi:hypothetical protein
VIALPVFPVDEPTVVVCAGKPLPVLTVDELLAGDPLCPAVLEYSVEPVPIVARLETVVLCVATLVSGILKRKNYR